MPMMRCPLPDLKDEKLRCAHLCAVTKKDGDRADRAVLALTCPDHKAIELNPSVWATEAGIAWTAPVVAPAPVASLPTPVAPPTEEEMVLAAAEKYLADKKAHEDRKAFETKVAAKVKDLSK